jgi:undecaprenyl-diphosphatase
MVSRSIHTANTIHPWWPAGVLILLFAGLVAAVSLHLSMGFDRAMILSLRDSTDIARPLGPDWLPETMRDITSLGSVVVALGFAAIVSGYLLLSGHRGAAALLFGSAVGALLLNDLLKFAIERPRPDAILQSARIFTSGFPSGHATLSCVTYISAAALFYERRARTYLLTIAILVVALTGFSRIYLGVHFPTDILGGWCIGSAWVCSCYPAIRNLRAANPRA